MTAAMDALVIDDDALSAELAAGMKRLRSDPAARHSSLALDPALPGPEFAV